MSSRLARRTSRLLTSSPCWLSRSRTKWVASGVECTNVLSVARPAHLGVAGDLPRELVGAAGGDDRAVGEDQNAVGEPLGLVEVVRGEQDRRALEVREPVHEVVELPSRLGVEAGRGLVEEQQLGPPDDPDRHVQAPALAARERDDLLVGELVQARPSRAAHRPGRAARSRASNRGRSSHRAGRAAGAASSAGGRATTAAPRRCARANPRPPAPGLRRAPGRRPPSARGIPRGSRSWWSSRRRWGRAGRSPRRDRPRSRRPRGRPVCRTACGGR